MRIVVHGQQAFGKAVLEALLERGDDVVAVYAAPEGARPDPLAEAAHAAGLPLVRPASFRDPAVVRGFRALRAGPPGHGVRHADRPAGVPLRAHARHDPVPPVAAAAAPWAQRDQLAGHQGRDRDRPHACSGPTAASTPATCCCSARRRSRRPTRSAPSTSTACSRWEWRRCSRRWTWSPPARLRGSPRTRRWPPTRRRASARTRASTGASRAGSSTTSSAAATRRRGPGPPAAARPCRSSRRRRSPPATSRASAARWERWPPSATTGFSVVCADGRLRVTRVRPAGGAKQGAGEWAAASGLVPGARLE